MNEFTPPVENSTADRLREAKAKSKLDSAVCNAISEMILESDAPEKIKCTIRVLNEVKNLTDFIRDEFLKYAEPGHNSSVETQKEVIQYLQLVRAGCVSFLATNPYKEN